MGGILERVSDWVIIWASQFFEGIDNRIALERRLRRQRQKDAIAQKKRMSKATDIGQMAILASQDLAVARIEARKIEDAVRQQATKAKRAQERALVATDPAAKEEATAEEQRCIIAATRLASELDEARANLAEQEQMVRDMFKDKDEAIHLVDQQAEKLRRAKREDARLVQQTTMAELQEDSARLKEQLMELVPGEEEEDVRARAREQLRKRSARIQARADLVRQLWATKTHGLALAEEEEARGASPGARQILDQALESVGYVPGRVQASAEETPRLTAKRGEQ